MAAKRFRIETDSQIARAILKSGSETRKELIARGNLAGIQYRALGKRIVNTKGYGSPDSPFEAKDQLSAFDKDAFKVEVRGDRLEISVNAPSAEYVESGNDGAEGENMAIRVKSSAVKRKKGKRGKTKLVLSSGAKVKRFNGKYYIFTQKVKPAKGYHLLEKAVRTAFRSR